jgi:hypothetical protein
MSSIFYMISSLLFFNSHLESILFLVAKRMTESLQIQFTGSQTSQGVCVFAAGQLVQAKLLLDLPKPMKARSIKLHISGGAEVQWTEKETYSYQTFEY